MSAIITPIDQIAHDRALDLRADQIHGAMLRGDYSEDLWLEIERMLARRHCPGGVAACEDMSLDDIIRAAAKVRAMSAVESREVEELAAVILGELRQ